MATRADSGSIAAKRDRAAGAVLGCLLGDALGLGPHWYYNLEELRREHGAWIDGYVAPKPGRYHEGCAAGDSSQTGQVAQLLLRSLAERGTYDQPDFCARLDAFLSTLDGTPYSSPYTDVAMRDLWRARKARPASVEGKAWGEGGSCSDTAEGAIRAVMLAARYAGSLGEAAQHAMTNVRLTHSDAVVAGQSMSFAILCAAVIQGEAIDADLGTRMRELAKSGDIPVTHAILAEERATIKEQPADPTQTLPFPDALLQVGWVVQAARDPEISVPPLKVPLLYGLACSIHMLMPAAYWYAARWQGQADHFEQAVLHAVNSGGNNMARAALTGALVGAMVGASAIPQRLLDGLTNGKELRALAERVAADAFPDPA